MQKKATPSARDRLHDNMKTKYLFLIIICCFFTGINFASAVSIGVKPIKIETESKIGEKISTEMLIKNTSNEPALYKIYPDDYQRNIKIVPNEFKLDSNEEKVIKVNSVFWLPGKKSTDLSVVARPLNVGSALSLPGVKVPFESKVSIGYAFYGMFLLALVAVVFVVKWKQNKK